MKYSVVTQIFLLFYFEFNKIVIKLKNWFQHTVLKLELTSVKIFSFISGNPNGRILQNSFHDLISHEKY